MTYKSGGHQLWHSSKKRRSPVVALFALALAVPSAALAQSQEQVGYITIPVIQTMAQVQYYTAQFTQECRDDSAGAKPPFPAGTCSCVERAVYNDGVSGALNQQIYLKAIKTNNAILKNILKAPISEQNEIKNAEIYVNQIFFTQSIAQDYEISCGEHFNK
jgi:hypothetical protein